MKKILGPLILAMQRSNLSLCEHDIQLVEEIVAGLNQRSYFGEVTCCFIGLTGIDRKKGEVFERVDNVLPAVDLLGKIECLAIRLRGALSVKAAMLPGRYS